MRDPRGAHRTIALCPTDRLTVFCGQVDNCITFTSLCPTNICDVEKFSCLTALLSLPILAALTAMLVRSIQTTRRFP